jgi:hypothetical protein
MITVDEHLSELAKLLAPKGIALTPLERDQFKLYFQLGHNAGINAVLEFLRSDEVVQEYQTDHYFSVTAWGPRLADAIEAHFKKEAKE